MHTAFREVNIVEKLPLTVSCISSWGEDLLLIGSTTGVLLVYEVKENAALRQGFEVKVLESMKGFARNKPILQLAVLGKHNLLVSLSEGYINIHDLGTKTIGSTRTPFISARTQLVKTKGASLFTVDESTPECRLCVAVKKRLLIYELAGNTKEYVEVKELSGPDVARTMAWAGDGVCVGFKKEYALINVRTGHLEELFKTGVKGVPIARSMPGNQLLLNKDNVSIFLSSEGKPTKKYGIVWNAPPVEFGYAYPFVLGLMPPKFVEIRTLATAASVQLISCKKAEFLSTGKGPVYVASSSAVWRLEPIPIATQVQQLVTDHEFVEALLLLDCLPDSNEKAEQKIDINKRYAYSLFAQGQHEASLDILGKLEDPLRILGLFPKMLPASYKFDYYYAIPEMVGPVLDSAYRSLSNYLRAFRKSEEYTSLAPYEPSAEGYAVACDHLGCIIDTSLLRTLTKLDNPALAEFVEEANFCDVVAAQRILLGASKYRELVMFYRGKAMHKKALQLLFKLGKEAPTGSPMLGTSALVNYLEGLGASEIELIIEYSTWPLQQDSLNSLSIFTCTRLGDDRLPHSKVLEHIDRVAQNLVPDYLEFTILKEGETSPAFHNQLIFSYLKVILALSGGKAISNSGIPAGSEPGLLGETRRKLLRFLNQSKYYKSEQMLSRFPLHDLYEERAILLSRIGRHDQALSVYIHKLGDLDAAEEYCNKHWDAKSDETRDVYLTLLRLYVQPTAPEHPVMLEAAIKLLTNHIDRINTHTALELLPDSTSLLSLEPFFQAVLSRNDRLTRDHQVMRALLRAQQLTVREEHIAVRSRYVEISDNLLCPVCDKVIGKVAMFVAKPDGTVLHYRCREKETNNDV